MDVLDNIGLAYVFEKHTITINNKVLEYYEKDECLIGVKFQFKNHDKTSFTVLHPRNIGTVIYLDYYYKDSWIFSGFKSIKDLSIENNYHSDIEKFYKYYSNNMDGYYIWNSKKNRLEIIENQKIIDSINKQKNNNKIDDSILNKDSDISQMYNEIKKTIIAQDEKIMQILTTLFKNQKVVNSKLDNDIINKLKENLIVHGPTGTGKTEILKRIAKIYNVPIVIEDSTSLSEVGYKGRDITDMLEDLYLAADKDINKAQKGILVLDEFDKLAEKKDNDHVSRTGVQRSLLKLLDGTTYYFDDIKFNTSKLSIVALGAFTDLKKENDNITTNDFVRYGIIRELMGRFSKLVEMNALSKKDIKEILLNSNFSPLNTYKHLFELLNINFSYDDEFIDYIVEKAFMTNSGARSLKNIFDEEISDALFKIFAGDYSDLHLTNKTTNENSYVLTKKI